MSNMDYCRFQNIVPDLKGCIDNFEDFDYLEASKNEKKAYLNFIKIIKDFSEYHNLKMVKSIIINRLEKEKNNAES